MYCILNILKSTFQDNFGFKAVLSAHKHIHFDDDNSEKQASKKCCFKSELDVIYMSYLNS